MTLAGVSKPTVHADAFSASVTAEGTATVVELCGDADQFTLPALVDVLIRVIADSDGTVIVDLSRIEFIDTSTVRALARASQFLDDRGRELTLRSPSKVALRVLMPFGLSRLIESDQTGNEAHPDRRSLQSKSTIRARRASDGILR